MLCRTPIRRQGTMIEINMMTPPIVGVWLFRIFSRCSNICSSDSPPKFISRGVSSICRLFRYRIIRLPMKVAQSKAKMNAILALNVRYANIPAPGTLSCSNQWNK